MGQYLHFVWHGVPADEAQETLLELDGERYDTRRIEHFADGTVFMASESLNPDYLAEMPWPTDAELAGEWEDVPFEVRPLTAQQFARVWTWAQNQKQRGK